MGFDDFVHDFVVFAMFCGMFDDFWIPNCRFFVVFRGIFAEFRTVVRTVCGQCCGPRCATRCSVLCATSGSGFLSEQTKQW